MKQFTFYILLFLYIPSIARSQSLARDSAYIQYIISYLAADSLCGREAGSIYEKKAAQFIASQFKNQKIKPLNGSCYLQYFNYSYDSLVKSSTNIIAAINNKAKKNIVIGAHYDHLGFGGKRSRSYSKHEVHNGADDNASGIALLLYLAGKLKKSATKNYNYFFVAFAAHEPGLFGSRYFVNSNIIDSSSVKLFINFDMIGRLDRNDPALFVSSTDSILDETLADTAIANNGFRIRKKEMCMGDHTAFISKKIPVLFITTGMHDDYHKISDDPEFINYTGLQAVARFVYKLILSIDYGTSEERK